MPDDTRAHLSELYSAYRRFRPDSKKAKRILWNMMQLVRTKDPRIAVNEGRIAAEWMREARKRSMMPRPRSGRGRARQESPIRRLGMRGTTVRGVTSNNVGRGKRAR